MRLDRKQDRLELGQVFHIIFSSQICHKEITRFLRVVD